MLNELDSKKYHAMVRMASTIMVHDTSHNIMQKLSEAFDKAKIKSGVYPDFICMNNETAGRIFHLRALSNNEDSVKWSGWNITTGDKMHVFDILGGNTLPENTILIGNSSHLNLKESLDDRRCTVVIRLIETTDRTPLVC